MAEVSVFLVVFLLIKYTWWLFLPLVLYSIFRPIWNAYAVNVIYFGEEINLTLLEIKIPKDLIANPKLMENVFATLMGAGRTITEYQKITFGRFQDFFSFEIVSLEGEIRFFVLTPGRAVRLVEKAFYGQFPNVEIRETKDDYFNHLPATIPDEQWTMWGAKMILDRDGCQPINTYPQMEDKLEGEMIDPLAVIFETMGTLGSGENLIYQVQVGLSDGSWRKKGDEAIQKILDKYNLSASSSYEEGNFMKILPFHELELLKAIHYKMAKPAYDTQILFAYIARKEVFNGIVSSAISGAMKMFDSSFNAFMTDKYYTSTANYFLGKSRKEFRTRRLFKLLQDRDMQGTANPFNIEELATLYHFPSPTVKVPSIPHIDSKRAPAPSNLPLGG